VLHVETVLGFSPEPEEQRAVDDGRDGKGEVVVLEPFRAEEQKERARDGRDEDAERDGRVVEKTWNVSWASTVGSTLDLPQR
jgi:hypothetical protein